MTSSVLYNSWSKITSYTVYEGLHVQLGTYPKTFRPNLEFQFPFCFLVFFREVRRSSLFDRSKTTPRPKLNIFKGEGQIPRPSRIRPVYLLSEIASTHSKSSGSTPINTGSRQDQDQSTRWPKLCFRAPIPFFFSNWLKLPASVTLGSCYSKKKEGSHIQTDICLWYPSNAPIHILCYNEKQRVRGKNKTTKL